jgi:hypothetical protein
LAKEPVRIDAVIAAVGFLAQEAFQGALALGAPLGRAAWGGIYDGQLPLGLLGSPAALRRASLCSSR